MAGIHIHARISTKDQPTWRTHEEPGYGGLFIGPLHLVLTRKEARALERAAYELATALEELELDAPEPVEAISAQAPADAVGA
jgi:hypothetical protein